MQHMLNATYLFIIRLKHITTLPLPFFLSLTPAHMHKALCAFLFMLMVSGSITECIGIKDSIHRILKDPRGDQHSNESELRKHSILI